jgi:hypothetical protein
MILQSSLFCITVLTLRLDNEDKKQTRKNEEPGVSCSKGGEHIIITRYEPYAENCTEYS